MKSEIIYTPASCIPPIILDKVSGIIREWELFTDLCAVFTLDFGHDAYLLRTQGKCITPEVCLNMTGELRHYLMGDPCHYRVGLASSATDGTGYLDFKGRVGFTEWRDTKDAMSKYIGVEDVFNIQPHEYGIIKLKHGVDRGSMFVPEEVKRMFRG